MGGNTPSFALHQVRNQILPDSELHFGGNTARDNTNGNYCNQVNDQHLPDRNPI